jgi:secondary thiamine-phosphate synthase enzyme
MRTIELRIDTNGRRVVDVTDEVAGFVKDAGGDGLLHAFLPHATAGLALMETGSGSEQDLEQLVSKLLPREDSYAHRHGPMGHGGDHLLPVLVSPSLVLPVAAGELALGVWQRIVIVDPNTQNNSRTLRLSLLPG